MILDTSVDSLLFIQHSHAHVCVRVRVLKCDCVGGGIIVSIKLKGCENENFCPVEWLVIKWQHFLVYLVLLRVNHYEFIRIYIF